MYREDQTVKDSRMQKFNNLISQFNIDQESANKPRLLNEIIITYLTVNNMSGVIAGGSLFLENENYFLKMSIKDDMLNISFHNRLVAREKNTSIPITWIRKTEIIEIASAPGHFILNFST